MKYQVDVQGKGREIFNDSLSALIYAGTLICVPSWVQDRIKQGPGKISWDYGFSGCTIEILGDDK